MSLVWELDLPDSEKLVLLALADCANDEGYCWPSIETIKKKCSKSERTVQNCIRTLCVKGHLTQKPGTHKSWDYLVHPIVRFASDTPAAAAPRKGCTPQPLRPTPAKAAPRPPQPLHPNHKENHQEPSPKLRAVPDAWWPKPFGEGTVSRGVVDGWPPGELEAQVEQFLAHHGSKNNSFSDLQKAFSTWVLNTRKWGIGRDGRTNGMGRNQPSDGLSATSRAALAVFGSSHERPVPQ